MKRLTATVAARRFSDMLDAVERGETFVVVRNGRAVACVGPAPAAHGAAVKRALRAHKPDASWAGELRALRSAVQIEERDWTD
jgi:antitoxin (DNA-binding transcriptional repressor) of toxin-antitoxin stability system